MVLLQRLLALRYRISTQLFAAIGIAVALTVIASLIGWLIFDRVGTSIDEVNETTIPGVESAFGVADYSFDLEVAVALLTSAATPAELDEVEQRIVATRGELQLHLETLDSVDGERARMVRDSSEALATNIEAIRGNREDAFDLDGKLLTLLEEMVVLLSELELELIPVGGDVHDLRIMRSYTDIALRRFQSESATLDPALVEAWEKASNSFLASFEREFSSLDDGQLKAKLEGQYEKIRDLSLSSDGILSGLHSRLQLDDEAATLLDSSTQQTSGLGSIADELVLTAVESGRQASESTSQIMKTGRISLLVISAIAVIAGLLIGLRIVGRALLHRIYLLTDKMRYMAAGQLDEEVDVIGRDELAEMGAALEVFRRNSREALRLDLVETLNKELEGKNTELEKVLEDLQTAQNQIVMREKLAALGEVTAGVAHEIRNPLNFVKNFSELSEEMLEEILSEIEDDQGEMDVSLIVEVSNDLVENLKRIKHHSDRADRIVNDMLLMGQSSNDWQSVDLNAHLVEHAMLAYHSARAKDPDFNLIVEQELDEEAGDIEAIPQNLGRVFLNIVGNACQATDEKRRNLANAGVGIEGYAPTVSLSTKGLKEEVEIRIRDNGVGIPSNVIERIFNPFFTTKPTNEGTGLGLSITSDIVREHAGSIHVESELDQFTEMVITVPRSSRSR